MKLTPFLLLFFISSFVLHSCGNPRKAPVTEISHSNNSKRYNSAHALSKQNKSKRSHIHVKKGDTLYSIGFSYNIDYKILAKINHIPAPFRIYPGQKLSLLSSNNSHRNQQKNNKNTTNNSANKTKPLAKPQLPKTSTSAKITKATKTLNTTKKPQTSAVKKIKSTTKLTKKSKTIKKPLQKAPASNSRWIWPVKGRIVRSFLASDVSRKGIDISIKHASSVYASNNGTVVYSGDGLRGYGQLIIIKHSNNLLSAYAHNSKRLVKEGQTVRQGQEIALSGKGTDGINLLHFEIRKNGQPVNPTIYLPKL